MISDSAWIGRKAIEIDAKGLEILWGPGVYMYLAGDLALYVGSAAKLGERALGKGHHRAKEFSRATSVILFPCASIHEAIKLEATLIDDLRPRHNCTNSKQIEDVAAQLGINAQRARQIRLCQHIQSE